MSLPYFWQPAGTVITTDPAVGMIWAYEHAALRIIEINDILDVDLTDAERERGWRFRPRHIVVRPAHLGDDVRVRDNDQHFRGTGSMLVYPDRHYPICARCLEPVPCREQMARQISERDAALMARYELAGVCPACSEPVTSRQSSATWDNIEVMFGPPVTFHLRRKCWWSAHRYEKRWAAEDPEQRKSVMSPTARNIAGEVG